MDGHGLLLTLRCSHFAMLKGICQVELVQGGYIWRSISGAQESYMVWKSEILVVGRLSCKLKTPKLFSSHVESLMQGGFVDMGK